MKRLFALLAIGYIAGQVKAQALTPVEAGFHWGPIVVIAIIGLAIAGLVLWHKRVPSKADAAIREGLVSAKDDAAALAHKTVEAFNALVKTNREQAMIIASPPVQAAINAGTPLQAAPTPQPTPQNAPQATIPPAPVVPSPQPTTKGSAMAFPEIDPATGRIVDESLWTTNPEAAKRAQQLAGNEVGLKYMTDADLHQAATYDAQHRNYLAKQFPNDPKAADWAAATPESVYAKLRKKQLALNG